MNDLLRKITAGILSVTMVLSGIGNAASGLFAYAHSGGGSTDSGDGQQTSVITDDPTGNTIAKDVTVDNTAKNWYVLEVSTGLQPGDCVKNIIIKYSDGGTSHTQVLEPSRTDYPAAFSNSAEVGSFNIDYSYVGPVNVSVYSAVPGGHMPYTGSKYISFSTLMSSNDMTKTIRPYLMNYLSMGGPVIPMSDEIKEKFPGLTALVKSTPFASRSVERIIFKTEFNISSLQSLSFYCEGNGNDTWDLKGWALYKVITGSGLLPELMLDTGTFISDEAVIDFKGSYIAGSHPNCPALKDSLGFVNAGTFTFTANDQNYAFITSGGKKELNNSTTLNFSINIMDTYGAGIDSFNKLAGKKLELQEMLVAGITYMDVNGFERYISVPVFENALMDFITKNGGAFDDARKNKLEDGSYLSYAQQGDSIVFSVALQDYASMVSMSLSYSNPVDDNDTLIIRNIEVYNNWQMKDNACRESYVVKDKDAKGNPVTINVGANGAGNTLLYTTEYVPSGTVLENVDPDKEFKFVKPETVTEPTRDLSTTYLVEIKTSDINFADTTDDVVVSFAYVSMDGKALQTQEYSIRESCKEYYGYNPGLTSNGIVEDGSYNYCMRQGGTVRFFIKVQNLDRITGMTVRLGDNAKDDWQMSSVKVYQVFKVGDRSVAPVYKGEGENKVASEATYGDITINRVYDREVAVKEKFSSETKIYVQKDQTENVDLEEGHSSSETERRDMSEYYYDMTYEMACSELHFDESAWKYQVIVNVQKNAIAGTLTDDCGSNNLFYFQLVFEKGTSGYVLANQQLKHDCFRSGEAETFNVMINENFGELVSVNIIADDTTEDAQELDKLCIDSIEVIKCNPDTANKRYVCENVGWINVDFIDNAEEFDKEGRNASELITSIPVDYSGYMLSLEIDLAIDTYTNDKITTTPQFVGGMKCNMVYLTNSGERKSTGDLDMVSLMYDYCGRIGSSDDIYGTISDPSFMFKAERINRFILDISDVSVVESITLSGKPMEGCDLPIGGIAIKVLKSDGTLLINDNGEFEKIYNIEPALLTDEIPGRNLPHKFAFNQGQWTSYTFTFGQNKIPELDTEESINSIVSRLPVSCNDTLNLYVYMMDGVPSPEEGNYKMTATVKYSSTSTTNTFTNICTKFKTRKENGRNVIYAQGLAASNISILTDLILNIDDIIRTDILADYVIVQQVRNGVAINTYRVSLSNHSLNTGAVMSYKNTASELGYAQKVTLLLGEGTKRAKLVPEEYDIALAITYTSKASGEKGEYKSAYVFATDNGTTVIQEGSILEFSFNEAYVDQIVSVEAIAMNGLEAVVEAGNIACTFADPDSGEFKTEGWFSMGDQTKLSRGGTKIPITSTNANDYNALKRAKFTFSTMGKSDVIDSAGTAPIKMVVAYRRGTGIVDENGAETLENTSVVIDDITKCAIGGFTAGEEAEVSVFLKGARSLIYAQIVPNDSDPATTASWNLDNVTFSLEGVADSSEHSMPVNRTIYEREETYKEDGDVTNFINLSTMTIGLQVGVEGKNEVSSTEPVQSVNISKDQSLSIGAYTTGGNSGYYAYFIDRVTAGKAQKVTNYTQTYGKVNLEFEGSTDSDELYRVTVMSVENPTMQIVLNVTVPKIVIEPQDQPPADVPGENGGNTTEENNSDTPNNDTPVNNNPDNNNTTDTTDNIGSLRNRSTKRKEEETSLDA